MAVTLRKIKRRTQRKYKSKLEQRTADLLPSFATYETTELPFIKEHKYYPDFTLCDTFYVESKGYFDAEDRAKHLLIKEQYPGLKVAFVFENSKNKLNRKSKVTYADWCDKHGFLWTDIKNGIPKEWEMYYGNQQEHRDPERDSTVPRGVKPRRARLRPASRPKSTT